MMVYLVVRDKAREVLRAKATREDAEAYVRLFEGTTGLDGARVVGIEVDAEGDAS